MQLRTVIPVWAVVAIGAVLVGIFSPAADYLQWIAIVLAAGALLTFCIELALSPRKGVVDRMMSSLGGAILILAVATLVLSLVHGSAR